MSPWALELEPVQALVLALAPELVAAPELAEDWGFHSQPTQLPRCPQ